MKTETATALPKMDSRRIVSVETATFGLGWFWGPDSQFGGLKGVVRTRVGYAGGTKKNPSYRNLGDHSEVVQVDYDPSVITYRELLDVFWKSHDPFSGGWSKQYANLVLYQGEKQRMLAEESRNSIADKKGRAVRTGIVPLERFYRAEDYHQKHSLGRFPELEDELRAHYPLIEDFIESPAVTRLNAYLGGYGSCDLLNTELGELGLSEKGQRRLQEVVCGRKATISCAVNK